MSKKELIYIASSLAASFYPNLFHSLVLIDPMIHQPRDISGFKPYINQFIRATVCRRETWSSRQVDFFFFFFHFNYYPLLLNHPTRQEALESFLKIPFFQAWDPAILKIYVECGIYLTKDEHGKEVAKLKMSGILEAVVSSHIVTMFEAYERLANLDERIAIRWLMPSKPVPLVFGPPGANKYRVWVRPKNSTNAKILGGSHFVRMLSLFFFFLEGGGVLIRFF